ncbi:MAG: L-histidine Nalpha-methyltransferase [Thermoleophilaceae bacterium]|jgi:L-histidine N-alpha-methyltransferase|nr:L-histidine Nalpha-methyltransferase [Thermoleophilaceae bacterium]
MRFQSQTEPYVQIDSYLEGNALASMAADVREGLSRDFKELSPKYFYDARGSELFELITEQPEYYQTRSERSILNRRAPEIAEITGAEELVELGSGSASKTRALLFAMAGRGALRRYVPVDVSDTVVERCAQELTEQFPDLSVHGLVGDFSRHLIHMPEGEKRLFAFLGGTIGNLYPPERIAFLASIADLMAADDALLLGIDLVKDTRVIEAAYNDAAGVTRDFNRNILHAINLSLGADFQAEYFDHVAFFDREQSRIEMRLRAQRPQTVQIPGAEVTVEFAQGEEVRTEISTKFTAESLGADLDAAGMRLDRFFTDDGGLFGLALARPA